LKGAFVGRIDPEDAAAGADFGHDELLALLLLVACLDDGFGDGAGVKFEALGWEDTLASTGRRSQEVINREIDCCDVFILAMHRRWGQAAPDAQPYSSYTEEEFHRAFHRWQGSGSGVRVSRRGCRLSHYKRCDF